MAIDMAGVEKAYATLLAHPHDRARLVYCQPALAVLRDIIADSQGTDPETVQDYWEKFVRDAHAEKAI